MRITLSWLSIFVGILVSLLAGVAHANPDKASEFHYFYFKEQRTLPVDALGRFAVRQSAQALAADRGAVPQNIAGSRLERHAIRGWSLVERSGLNAAGERRAIDAAFADRAQMAARIDELAKDPSVEFVSPVFVDEFGGALIVTQDLMIGFRDGVPQAQRDELLAMEDVGVIVAEDWANMRGVVRVRSASRSGLDVLNVANRLAQRDEVLFAEPDVIFTGRGGFLPNDAGFGNCWGLHNTGQFGGSPDMDMDGPEAWDATIGVPAIKVVVIDTGVTQNHPDINQVTGADLTSEGPGNGGPVNAFDNHGTAVAGCVSATINNGIGTVGIAPGCKSASARTFISTNSSGNWTSTASWTVDAITFGESIGARVTNNSNGYGFTSSAIATKYSTSRTAGMVHFASAGNSGTTTIGYPANLSTVNAVAALDPTGSIASFSDRGVGLAFSAPGTSVYTTDRTGADGYNGSDYAFVQGTSFSSPYTSGVAALVLSKNAMQSAANVESILQNSCVDRGAPGYDTTYGWGFVNAAAALAITPTAGPPGAFSLLSPASGAINVPRQPSFSWQGASNAPTYVFTLDDNSDFSSPLVSTMTSLDSYVYTGTPLPVSTVFYWKVVASNGLGSTMSTPVSASFTTLSSPPGSFAMTMPTNGATGVSVLPSLRWDAAPLAEGYLVTVDDSADLMSPIIQFATTFTSFTPGTSLAPSTTFYWTVSATNAIGSTPATTGTWSFTTTATPPLGFSLLSPPDGPNVSTSTPALTWQSSGGADTYRLVVDDDLAFGSPAIDALGLVSTNYQVAPGVLTSGVRYYWKVTAHNGAGSTASTPASASFGVLVPLCAGNANGDGIVNFDDITSVLSAWLANYLPALNGVGDANHDGVVNFSDITSVLGAWGAICPQ